MVARLYATVEGKPLHGQFPTQVEALSTVDCAYKWLRVSSLKIETEALLCAAQDQALSTNAFKVNILSYSQDPSCRVCHTAPETIHHLLSACSMLAATEYLTWHSSVASLIHKSLCTHLGVVTCGKPWLYVLESVVQVIEVK